MIRGLYFRITATFLVIVLISIGVAFLFTNQMFKRDARGQLPNQLEKSIARIEQLYAVSKPQICKHFWKRSQACKGSQLSLLAAPTI